MPVNLRGRHYLKLLDYTPAEIRYLLELSKDLRTAAAAATAASVMGMANQMASAAAKGSRQISAPLTTIPREIEMRKETAGFNRAWK